MKCQHGFEISLQSGITAEDIASWPDTTGETDDAGLLAFYSACDCCDSLMHHSTCGHGYFVMKDGRTLCWQCAKTEPRDAFDGANPFDRNDQ